MFCLSLSPAEAFAAPSPNDNFANAQVLTGNSGTATGTNLNATKQTGEPNHANVAGSQSVWYQWTAPFTGRAEFSTLPSSFDTLLGVYTGTSVEALSEIASNDDDFGAPLGQSLVNFSMVAGTVYRIAVDGYGVATGNITLNFTTYPENDNFVDAEYLPGNSGTVTGIDFNATKEVGEPNHAGNSGGASVWYVWVAPSSVATTFDTLTSSFDTLLAVYTGNSVNALTAIASNNNDPAGGVQSRLTFSAVGGTAYWIAVDGFNAGGGAVKGSIVLHYAVNVNAPPVVTSTAGSVAYTENQAATIIDGGLTVSDPDSANLAGGTVAIAGNFATGEDLLTFANQGGIAGSYNATTGVLALSGTATVAAYQAALRSVTYANSSENPSALQRTVSFSLSDGTASGSNTRTINVSAVPDAPIVTTTAGSAFYGATQAAVAVDSGVAVTDIDSPSLTSASVSITGNFAMGEDVLAFANQGGISGNYNITNGVLALSGTATTAAYQAALRTVTYSNSINNPSTLQRTVTFTAIDGVNSGSNIRTINVTSSPNAPVVTTTAGNSTYVENQAPTAIDAGLAVTDLDSANLAGGTVAIAGNFASGQDTLAFTSVGGILGNYNGSTGVLTLTGAASTANYQTALRSVTFANSSENPSALPRDIIFTVSDGSLTGSNSRAINVTAVPDAPVVTTSGGTLAYASTSAATAIDSGLFVTDVDSSDLTGATVTISGNFTGSDDALAFVNQGGISGSYDSGGGVLTLSGSASLAAYQAALRTVTYSNSSATPSTALRTVTFSVNDGSQSGSNTRTISVTAPPAFHTLTLIVDPAASGTLTPNPLPNDQGKYADGTVVTLTADASSGFTFDSFSGDATGSTNPVQITVNGNKSVTANFTADPIVPVAGTYFGLVGASAKAFATSGFQHATSGFLKIAVTATAQFTCTLKYSGQTVAFRGKFAGQTTISKLITIPNHGTVTLVLTGQPDAIAGYIQDDGVTAAIAANRNGFNKLTNPAPQAGRYTLLTEPTSEFLGQSDIPQGFGGGTVIVKTSGTVKIAGKLGDGSAFGVGSGLSKFGTVPLYAVAYKKLGSLHGMAIFQKNAGQSDGDGVLSWFKPPQSLDPLYPVGFRTQVNWIASKYAAPIPGQRVLQLPDSPANLRVTLAGGNVAGFAPFSVTLDRKNIVTGNGGVGFKLILTPATGAFSGSFIDQSTHTPRSFSGSVFQEQNLGSGFFIGSGETGVVLLESSSTTTVRSDGSGVEP